MKQFRFLLLSIVVLFACSVFAFADVSKRLELESKDLKPENPVMKGVESQKKIQPRLPNGYGKLVSTKQREEIYAIQREYLPLLELLKLRTELLKAEMDTKIKGVLTVDQAKKVEKPKATQEQETVTEDEK